MTLPDLIFLAILLVFSNIWQAQPIQTQGPVIITIPIYGEIYNNRQLELRIQFIKFISAYIYNYVQYSFPEHDYIINVSSTNALEFQLSPGLYSAISHHFATNIIHHNSPNPASLTNVTWLSRLSSTYRAKFANYILLFMNYANSKGFYFMSRENHAQVNQVNQTLSKYLSSHPATQNYYNYITEPLNMGSSKYGFKVNLKHIKKYIITNGLIISLCNIGQHYPGPEIPKLIESHVDFAIAYITQTYLDYKINVLDVTEYITDPNNLPDVFI